jgi:hypothetical protein
MDEVADLRASRIIVEFCCRSKRQSSSVMGTGPLGILILIV